ncbi:hypothetical protein MBANPS3_011780 [Mucor bainieri]
MVIPIIKIGSGLDFLQTTSLYQGTIFLTFAACEDVPVCSVSSVIPQIDSQQHNSDFCGYMVESDMASYDESAESHALLWMFIFVQDMHIETIIIYSILLHFQSCEL